jgi:hypothetical protein
MRFYEYLRRAYSGCSCNTSTTDLWNEDVWGGTDSTDSNCPYCTNTATGDTKEKNEELFRKEQEREDLQLQELGKIARQKQQVNIPIISQNVISKTMNRRMMNSRH